MEDRGEDKCLENAIFHLFNLLITSANVPKGGRWKIEMHFLYEGYV